MKSDPRRVARLVSSYPLFVSCGTGSGKHRSEPWAGSYRRGEAKRGFGAHAGIRTQDLILTKNVLCLLSYVGAVHGKLYPKIVLTR